MTNSVRRPARACSLENALVNVLSLPAVLTRAFQVVFGGTHMVSRFCHFLVGRTRSPDFVILSFFAESTVRVGLVHLVVFGERLLVVRLTGGGETGSPPPPSPTASSTTAAGTSEEEGLHTTLFLTFSRWPSCSSPGTSEEEGLAPLPSSSHCQWVPRRKRDMQSSSQRPPVPRRRKDRPSSSHRRCVLHALTYRAVTVEGDQQIVTSAVRQSNESYQGLDLLANHAK